MHHDPLVHEPDPDRFATGREHRQDGREAVAVDREAAEGVVRDPGVVAVDLHLVRLRLDDERPEQAAPDLVGRVVMRVVHERTGSPSRELVGVRAARDDRQLGHERDPVLEEVVELDAVEVDPGRLLHVVGEGDLDLVALGDLDRRPGPLLVEAEGRDRRLHLVDRLVDLVDRHVEDLDAVLDPRGERGQDVVQDQLRDLGEGGLVLELRVRVGGAENLDELGERRVAVDVLEGRGEAADVAPDHRPGLDVVLGPAGRDRAARGTGGGRRR